jgi:hypothetical protein
MFLYASLVLHGKDITLGVKCTWRRDQTGMLQCHGIPLQFITFAVMLSANRMELGWPLIRAVYLEEEQLDSSAELNVLGSPLFNPQSNALGPQPPHSLPYQAPEENPTPSQNPLQRLFFVTFPLQTLPLRTRTISHRMPPAARLPFQIGSYQVPWREAQVPTRVPSRDCDPSAADRTESHQLALCVPKDGDAGTGTLR